MTKAQAGRRVPVAAAATVRITAFMAAALVLTPTVASAKGPLSDAAIKQRIIRASVEAYPGNCPCPYNAARNGSSCGGRSAWSRAGGYAPQCYAGDVSKAEVRAWRAAH